MSLSEPSHVVVEELIYHCVTLEYRFVVDRVAIALGHANEIIIGYMTISVGKLGCNFLILH